VKYFNNINVLPDRCLRSERTNKFGFRPKTGMWARDVSDISVFGDAERRIVALL
jgi:hypothetical protein